jgi:hypothetical protein
MQTQFLGTSMGFVLRLDPQGQGSSDAHYLSYFGAGGRGSATLLWEGLNGLAPLDDGRFVVTGFTDNPAFPRSGGAYQPTYGGGMWEATVSRVDLLPQNAIPFGTGTAPCGPLLDLQVNGNPVSPNLAFALICNDAPGGASGALVVGIPSSAGLTVLNAQLWLVPSVLVLVPMVADPGGFARAPLPIPAGVSPASLGLQHFWANPASCAKTLSTSSGLELRL